MVAGNSSEWLPPGFEEKIEVKNGRKVKYYYNVATGMKYNSKKDVIIYSKTQEIFHDTSQEINNGENGLSFNNEVDAISVETNKSPEWLPDGWRMEEKMRNKGSHEGSKYKIYIDLSTGNKFYSRLAVARYLKNLDPNDGMTEQPELDNLGEPFSKPDTPLHSKSLTEAGYIPEKVLKREKSFTVAATESTSAGGPPSSEAGYIPGKKLKGKESFTVVATESTTADGVPPRSVRERSRKSRNKTSKPDNTGLTLTKTDLRLECKSMTNEDCIPKTRKRKQSFMMVASESTIAEGLPPGWMKKIKTSKSGNKIRKDPYYEDPINGYIFHSKKDVMRYLETNDIGSCAIIPKRQKLVENTIPPKENLQCKPMTDEGCIPEPKKSSKQSFTMSANESTYVEGLPPGWIKEIQTRKSGNKIRKNPHYIDPVSGYVFLSKKDVMRYLETNDIGSCAITPKRRELDGLQLIKNKIHFDNVGETCLKPDISVQSQSMIDASSVIEKQKKNQDSSIEVATEITSADGLPPGWIKEIKSSKSGNKIRKDPYYIDPVSDYMFRSKKDALRFLETNDIGSCAITPKKRESDDQKLINSKITPLSPTNRKLSDHHETKEKLFSGGKSKGRGGDSSGVESPAASKTKISKIAFSGGDSLQDSTEVATGITSADGLPQGWIKEIKTSKSGNKIRKDLYYMDPVSGYIFRSKKDVLRFLETNDIGSCAITPKKREYDDLKLIKNEIPVNKSLSPTTRKSYDHLETKLVSGVESNGDGGESSSSKSLAASKAKVLNSSFNVADSLQDSSVIATEITSADGLPPGWIKEIKSIKSGNKIRKNPYYIDPVSGYIFYSKKDAFRFLETNDIGSCAITPKKRESDDLNLIKNKTTATSLSPTNQKLSDHLETQNKLFSGGESSAIRTRAASKAKISNTAFAVADSLQDYPLVAAEITSADGLPPGWVKEVKISKSWNKIRKDMYYIDPVTGYMFRSRKDVLRFLETNDIGSCAITPKKRESGDLKLIKNKTTSSSPANRKLSDHLETKDKLFSGGESNGGGEDSCVKNLAASKAKISKFAFAGADSLQDSTVVATEITSADGLPSGWLKEIKICKSGDKIRKDPYYTDPVSGNVFRSKKDALRFLETNDIGSCAIKPKKRESDDLKLINDKTPSLSPANQKLSDHLETQHKLFSGGESNGGGESFPVKSQAASKAKISKAASAEANSFQNSTTVSVEITSADGLPPGWMKEVKTSYSGNKIRKDPLYYIDPVDGYIFRSRKDVLRFLETNDIGSCAMTPMKRKSDDLKLIKNKTTSLSPVNRELSDQLATKSNLFPDGEPNSNVGDSFNVEYLAASKAKISNIGFDEVSTFTSSELVLHTKIGPEQTNPCSEQGSGAMADVLAICSFINESSTEEKLPESGMERQTDVTRLKPRKSVKRRDLNLPTPGSKRLSKPESEMISNVDLNEQPFGVLVENSSVTCIPLQSDLCQEKNAAIRTLSGEATHLEEERLNKDEKLLIERAQGKANDNQLNAGTISQNPEPSYAFGDSWADPCLQFAFKTLTGEITIEDTLSSPGIPDNQEDEGIVTPEPKVPTMFESDIPPGFESVEQSNIAEKLPVNPPVPAPTGSTLFQVDEIPPGFESVVQNNTADKFSPSP